MLESTNILDSIFEQKRQEVAQRKAKVDLRTMRRWASEQKPPLDFLGSISTRKPALIAEVKRASPSKGEFGLRYSALELAQLYFANGAAAVSVLTDEAYFRGNLDDLKSTAGLPQRAPLLQKDFICDPYQVYEARAYGADAVLLIASYLDFDLMQELHDLATELGMSALVETHTAEEIEKALRIDGLKIVGVNNRNLRNFQVDLQTCIRLRTLVPAEICYVAESGIHTAKDVLDLRKHDIHIMLVGEALVKSENPIQKIEELLLFR